MSEGLAESAADDIDMVIQVVQFNDTAPGGTDHTDTMRVIDHQVSAMRFA
jgi:hypothetical protein